MKKIIKEKGETLLGKYTINCIPFKGERFLGKLYVTDVAFYYEAQYDMSMDGIFDQIATSAAVSSGHALLVSESIKDQWKSKGFMHVLKSDIQDVSSKTSLFKKSVFVTLIDEQLIEFDYGVLGVKQLVKDLKA